MKIAEGKNSQNTTSFLSRKNIAIVRSKLNRIFHTSLASCVERFLPRHDAFFSFPDSILPGVFNTLRLNNCKCGVTLTSKILVSRSVALCEGARVVGVFFFFFVGNGLKSLQTFNYFSAFKANNAFYSRKKESLHIAPFQNYFPRERWLHA